jgi:hypothetical protein
MQRALSASGSVAAWRPAVEVLYDLSVKCSAAVCLHLCWNAPGCIEERLHRFSVATKVAGAILRRLCSCFWGNDGTNHSRGVVVPEPRRSHPLTTTGAFVSSAPSLTTTSVSPAVAAAADRELGAVEAAAFLERVHHLPGATGAAAATQRAEGGSTEQPLLALSQMRPDVDALRQEGNSLFTKVPSLLSSGAQQVFLLCRLLVLLLKVRDEHSKLIATLYLRIFGTGQVLGSG